MDKSLALSHIRQLEIIANHWDNEGSGGNEVSYLARRAVRQIRRIAEVLDAVDIQGREDTRENAEDVRIEAGDVGVLRIGEQGDDQGGAPSDVEIDRAS